MTWLGTAPSVVVALVVLLVPGLGVGILLGARGLILWAAAAPVSLSVVGTTAVAAQVLGVRWSLLPLALATASVWLLAWRLGRRIRGRRPIEIREPERSTNVPAALAWAGAALVLGAHIIYMVGDPANIAHLHDNVFHLNAVRFVEQSGNGSSMFLGHLGVDELTSFYPAAWHDVVALVSSTSAAGVPTAINVTNLALLCTAWPLGCMLLTSAVTRVDGLAAVVGAVLSTAFSGFPYLLYHFGVVYPWMTAMALLPGVLGLVVLAVKPADVSAGRRRTASLLVMASVPGLALAHPSVLTLSMALAAPVVLATASRSRTLRGLRGIPLLAVVYVVTLVVVWTLVRPPRASNWEGVGDPLGAFVRAAMMAPVGGPIPWILVAVVMVGLAVLPRWANRMWVFWTFATGLLLVVASNLRQAPELRWWLSGVWYSDPFRAATIVTVAMLPVAALGTYSTISAVRSRVSLSGAVRHTAVRTTVTVLAVVLGFALARTPAVAYSTEIGRRAHSYTPSSRLVTIHELRLFRQLDEYVPADALIAGDPQTGAALSYAFAGRESVQPFVGLNRGSDGAMVMDRLNQMRVDPAVCSAVLRLNVQFVLDFGDQAVDRDQASRVPGLQDLTAQNGFMLVAQEGPAKLYRITGCPSKTSG